MVFRRDNNRVDSFQRQMSSLRQQIGADDLDDAELDIEERSAPPERSRQRQASDEGYSFGSFPSSGVSTGSPESYDDESFPPDVPEMPQADQEVSVVSAGTTWKGDLESQGSIHVYGTVTGSLSATEDVWVARGAEVDATIEADRVVVAGTVAGSVTARSRFEALPDGELLADVNAPTFVVHEGATINGALSMTGRETRGGEARGAEARDRSNRSASIIQRRNRTSS